MPGTTFPTQLPTTPSPVSPPRPRIPYPNWKPGRFSTVLFNIITAVFLLDFLQTLLQRQQFDFIRDTQADLDPLEPDRDSDRKVSTYCQVHNVRQPRDKGCRSHEDCVKSLNTAVKKLENLDIFAPKLLLPAGPSEVGLNALVDSWAEIVESICDDVEQHLTDNLNCGSPRRPNDCRKIVWKNVSVCVLKESDLNAD